MATIKQLSFPSAEWMQAVEDLVAGVQVLAGASGEINDVDTARLANIRALADRVRELESDEPPNVDVDFAARYDADDGPLSASDLEAVSKLASAKMPKGSVLRKQSLSDVAALTAPELEPIAETEPGFASLLQMASDIVRNSTAPEAAGFDTATWLRQWMERPQPALGGQKPADLIGTPDGLAAVQRVLRAIESGAFL